MNKWKINAPDSAAVRSLQKETGVSEFICRILASRGITTRAEAESFFNGTELSDPFLIKDMDKAVEVITEAIAGGTHITVYGDYDCDGVTSTYMLLNYLEACGAEVNWYIPTRDEGYGLNKPAVEKLKKQGTELIITVDNGISAVEEAAYIKELGMRLLITDHHQVPEVMPEAVAIVNPHRPDDNSPYKEFAGCGVVLKLLMALEKSQEGDPDSVFSQYADVAAIGTVADIVRLDGENRIIVREGMLLLEKTDNIGLNRLLIMSGLPQGDAVTSEFLGFKVCPKINAAGRFATPQLAMDVLLAETANTAERSSLELCELNDLRRKEEAAIVEQSEQQIRSDPDILNRKLLIVCGKGWKHGVIGNVSSSLLHKYGKPNIVITDEGETARGSGRSTEGLPLFEMLTACSDKLIRFGGHPKAAGLTVASDRIEELRQALYDYCDKNVSGSPVDVLEADFELRPEEVTLENVELIENLEPFGEGNREPLFLMRECTIKSTRPLKDGKYVMFSVDFGGRELKAIHFGSTFEGFEFSVGDKVDLLANLAVNEYRDSRTVNVYVRDAMFSGFDQNRYFAAKAAYEEYRCGHVEPRLLCRMAPTTEENRAVYDILRLTGSLSKAVTMAERRGINYCKFRIVLDIFEEFGLAAYDITRNSVRLLPPKGKADFSRSRVLAGLRQAAE